MYGLMILVQRFLFLSFTVSIFVRMCYFQVDGNMTVDGIQYYITDIFGEGLYESCKDVKFGTMNTRALEFIGSGAKNFKGTLSLPFPLSQARVHMHMEGQMHAQAHRKGTQKMNALNKLN